ncbi:MAG: dihydrofolate reductase [Clostridia bacterium]|nr:dihydrofolate reductase [Clostridia bacterium]
MTVSMIAAVGKNLELGKNNGLIWHLDGDLPFFKKTTMGCPVIMGRRTFESLPRALPGRKNIVLTRAKNAEFEGAFAAESVSRALELCGDADEVFIIGGAQVYGLFLPLADRLYLTEADAECPEADAYFPRFDAEDFDRTEIGSGGGEIGYVRALYTRKK